MSRANLNTPNKKKLEYFSDFTTDLSAHPVTAELARLTNEQAVKRSIRNIILTNKRERLFDPEFGCDLSRLLFEPMTTSTSDSIKHTINDAIIKHEPRVRLSDIQVIADEMNHMYRVNIVFLILNAKEPTGMTVTLKRIR